MTYEEFKQLAEHPQHRGVPAIFKLEVLETEELEEKKRSHYPKYKVNTYCPQAFTTTLEEAESLMHQDVLYRKKMKEEDDYPLDIHFVEDTSVLFAEHDVQIVWHIRYSSRL